MKKILIRSGILLAVFIIAIIFFYNTVDEHSFADEITTVEAREASLPIVSFVVNGNEINRTKGYTISRDSHYPRESITPVSTEKSFSVLIKDKGAGVKVIEVDILDIPGLNGISHYETNDIKRTNDGMIRSDVEITEPLTENAEYLLKVTLTTSVGDKVYYYTRLQVSTYGSLSESVKFLHDFHEATLDKEKVYELDGVMECDEDTIITDYSHININSNLDALSFGNMNPVESYRHVPTITEYNEQYVSAALDFGLEVYTGDGREELECKEEFRFRYTSQRTYLFNYDRKIETVFDGDYFTVGKNEMKLGLAEDIELDKITSPDSMQMLFSYQGTLWHLNMEKNKLVKVLTYRNSDYNRSLCDDYGFKLLGIDDSGDADFAVYGYIGKGVYEGRMGIVYYHYYAADGRIEEKMFIPVTVGYDELKDEFGEVSYTSDFDIFYFTLFDAYYSYELETNVLSEISGNLGENWLYFKDRNIICYNSDGEPGAANSITVTDITKQEKSYIYAPEGKFITLLGTVDGRIVYGFGNADRLSFYPDGGTMSPLEGIYIVELDGSVVKSYEPPEGTLIGEVEFNPGVIDISLYKPVSGAAGESKAYFEYFDNDVIINLNKTTDETVSYPSKVNESVGKEYYVTLPSSYVPEKNPDKSGTVFTVITTDTSAITKDGEEYRYHVYAYGKLLLSTDDLAEALFRANESLGTVVDNKGEPIWRRGIVSDSKALEGVELKWAGDTYTKEQAVLQMLIDYQGLTADAAGFDMKKQPMLLWMRETLSATADIAENANLEQVLYFVSAGHPVIAAYEDYYVVITGYSEDNVTFMNPVTGNTVTKSRKDSEELFKKAGGIYYIY